MKPFTLRGTVVPGSGLGRRLGFPTANVLIPREQLPPLGVYRTAAVWKGAPLHPAVCNVGVRPTLGPSGEVWVEVHVLDFTGDLYGKELEVRFLDKIRDEQRFDSLSRLVEQIRLDAEAVRAACLREAAGGSGRRGRPASGCGGTPSRRSGRKEGPS